MVSGDDAPRVFVTYAHDSPAHKADVLEFATLLVKSGIHVELDQWADVDRMDWGAWAIRQMTSADRIAVVVSPQYKEAGDGSGPADANRGVQSEAAVLRDLQHGDRATWLPKLLPVVLPGHTIHEIPHFLQPYSASHYVVEEISATGIEDLLRVITRQPALVRPARGVVPVLPPASGPRPAATTLVEPVEPTWRTDLVRHGQVPTLEVHLVPVGGTGRIPVLRLPPLADELAALGRSTRLFGNGEPLTIDSSDQEAWAFSPDYRKSSGMVVRRGGQRSAWTELPHGSLGYVLIPDEAASRVADLLTALLSLDLPSHGPVAPAIGLEPLTSVRIGTRADLTASRAAVHSTYPAHIRVPAEEAYTVDRLRASVVEVADELTARLVASFRWKCR